MSKLSDRLQELCAERKITGADLCRAIGYKSKSLISELSSGRKQSITADTALRIANFFDVSVPYLLGETDQKEKPSIQTDEGQGKNTIRIAGRNGEYKEYHLAEEQIDLLQRMIDQMADFTD